ncbi:CBS domain-containing protein [Halobacteriales archaeon Cl-PHB]
MRRPQLQPMGVEDLVQTDVVTATHDDTIESVASRMADANVGSVVVVENDSPVGVLTDRKIALNLPQMANPTNATVADLVSERDLVLGTLEMTVFEALEQLGEANVRRLPIVDEAEGTLAGIVTLDDLVVVLTSELKNASDIIRAQSPRL